MILHSLKNVKRLDTEGKMDMHCNASFRGQSITANLPSPQLKQALVHCPICLPLTHRVHTCSSFVLILTVFLVCFICWSVPCELFVCVFFLANFGSNQSLGVFYWFGGTLAAAEYHLSWAKFHPPFRENGAWEVGQCVIIWLPGPLISLCQAP